MPFANMGGWSFVLIVVIILLLFGAPRLPKLAKSLGESMRIFKGEMKTMKGEKGQANPSETARGTDASAPTAGPAAPTNPADSTPPGPVPGTANESPADGSDSTTR